MNSVQTAAKFTILHTKQPGLKFPD